MASLLTCSNVMLALPSAADSVSVTPSNVAWSNSAWVQLAASMAADSVLCGIAWINGVAAPDFEIDIGVGAAGSEVVICTVKDYANQTTGGAAGPGYHPLPIPIDAIPASSRVAVRMRKSGTSTTAWRFSITYVEKPVSGTVLTTTRPLKCVPSAAALTALAGAPAVAWANSNWTQLIAAATADLVLCGIVAFGESGSTEFEVGVGAAGAEVPVALVRADYSNSTSAGGNARYFPHPVDAIPSGSRVAVRFRASGTTPVASAAGLLYMEKPL